MRKCKNSVHSRRDFLVSRVPCFCAISYGMSTTTKSNARRIWNWNKLIMFWMKLSNIHDLAWTRKPNMVRSKLYMECERRIFIQKKKNEELLKSHCDPFICSTSVLCTKSYLLPELTLKISISWVWKGFMEEMEV